MIAWDNDRPPRQPKFDAKPYGRWLVWALTALTLIALAMAGYGVWWGIWGNQQ